MDLAVFEKDFIRKYKHANKKMIGKNKNLDDNLKAFLKGGVSELSQVFGKIIESKFTISDEEIESEFDDAEINLSAKFKAKNPEYKVFKHAVENEVLNFVKFYQAVKILDNGDRMSKFEKLCETTTSSIISNIVK